MSWGSRNWPSSAGKSSEWASNCWILPRREGGREREGRRGGREGVGREGEGGGQREGGRMWSGQPCTKTPMNNEQCNLPLSRYCLKRKSEKPCGKESRVSRLAETTHLSHPHAC